MHCYPNKKLFLSEVSRVLKPNGLFLLTDVFSIGSAYKKDTEHNNLKCISDTDITSNVADACRSAWTEFKALPESDAKKWSINLYREKYTEYAQNKYQYRILTFKNTKG